jgi:Predicted O-methyltransferase
VFSLIHRGDHVDQIIHAMGQRFGALEILPLRPKAKQQAKRVIIRAIKGSKAPALLHSGLVLHEESGSYTQEAENVLRHAQALV